MSVGRLFQAAGPATQNARMPSHRLVCGTTRSPWAAERSIDSCGRKESVLIVNC